MCFRFLSGAFLFSFDNFVKGVSADSVVPLSLPRSFVSPSEHDSLLLVFAVFLLGLSSWSSSMDETLPLFSTTLKPDAISAFPGGLDFFSVWVTVRRISCRFNCFFTLPLYEALDTRLEVAACSERYSAWWSVVYVAWLLEHLLFTCPLSLKNVNLIAFLQVETWCPFSRHFEHVSMEPPSNLVVKGDTSDQRIPFRKGISWTGLGSVV